MNDNQLQQNLFFNNNRPRSWEALSTKEILGNKNQLSQLPWVKIYEKYCIEISYDKMKSIDTVN